MGINEGLEPLGPVPQFVVFEEVEGGEELACDISGGSGQGIIGDQSPVQS